MTVTCTCGQVVELEPTDRARVYRLAEHTFVLRSRELIKRGPVRTWADLAPAVFRARCPLSGAELEEQ